LAFPTDFCGDLEEVSRVKLQSKIKMNKHRHEISGLVVTPFSLSSSNTYFLDQWHQGIGFSSFL